MMRQESAEIDCERTYLGRFGLARKANGSRLAKTVKHRVLRLLSVYLSFSRITLSIPEAPHPRGAAPRRRKGRSSGAGAPETMATVQIASE